MSHVAWRGAVSARLRADRSERWLHSPFRVSCGTPCDVSTAVTLIKPAYPLVFPFPWSAGVVRAAGAWLSGTQAPHYEAVSVNACRRWFTSSEAGSQIRLIQRLCCRVIISVVLKAFGMRVRGTTRRVPVRRICAGGPEGLYMK